MSTLPFHYEVKLKIIKCEDPVDIEEFSQSFSDNNPIEAREKAFDYFKDRAADIMASKGQKFVSDKKAREFFNREIHGGIELHFVLDTPFIEYDNGKHLIYAINAFDSFADPIEMIDALDTEYEFYSKLGLSTLNYDEKINFYYEDADETREVNILFTPFDWNGFDKPNAEASFVNLKNMNYAEKYRLVEKAKEGEKEDVEYKPALLYHFITKAAGIGIKYQNARTICGFMNSKKGGTLIIGISDDGSVQGLEYDFSLSPTHKDPKDFFRLEFDQMFSYFIGMEYRSNIQANFVKFDEKEVFRVEVLPARTGPVFLKGRDGKEFWIRATASTQSLKDIGNIVNYCLENWGLIIN